ncbi:MAG: hypothetical protein ABIT58_09950 [Ferruginibacter sp.]
MKMNEQPRSKVLIMIIGILLIANIVMLAFMLGNQNKKREQGGRDSYVRDYLEKEIGFDARQMNLYDTLSKKHRSELKSVFNGLNAERKKSFRGLVRASFSDSAINTAANEVHEHQKSLELSMLKYLRDVRSICTETQISHFDTGFYKIFGKRGSFHKEK